MIAKAIDRKYQPDARRLGEDRAASLKREMDSFLAERERRIQALTQKVDKRLGRVGKPKSHRGARRKVVILSMIDAAGACPVFPSVSEAAAVLGVECNVVCGAIRRGGTVGRRLNSHPGMLELSALAKILRETESLMNHADHVELYRLAGQAQRFRSNLARTLQQIREASTHHIAYLDQIGTKGRTDGDRFFPAFEVKSSEQIAGDRAMAPATSYHDSCGQLLLFRAPIHTTKGRTPSEPRKTSAAQPGGLFGHTTKPVTVVGARRVAIPQTHSGVYAA